MVNFSRAFCHPLPRSMSAVAKYWKLSLIKNTNPNSNPNPSYNPNNTFNRCYISKGNIKRPSLLICTCDHVTVLFHGLFHTKVLIYILVLRFTQTRGLTQKEYQRHGQVVRKYYTSYEPQKHLQTFVLRG